MYGKSNCKEGSNGIKGTSSRPLKKYYFTALFDFRTFVWPSESSSRKNMNQLIWLGYRQQSATSICRNIPRSQLKRNKIRPKEQSTDV
jgi:hypothetical protein